MKLQEIKDKEAQKYGHETFNDFLESAKSRKGGTCYGQMDKMLSNVARIYAQEKCKEQREICADHSDNDKSFKYNRILNAPEPTFD